MASMIENEPEAHEAYKLDIGERKITYTRDEKMQNCWLFRINKEDHTIGNALTTQLHHDPRVLFAGYKFTHPLENWILLRVQTTPDYTPGEALSTAINDIISEEEFKRIQPAASGADAADHFNY